MDRPREGMVLERFFKRADSRVSNQEQPEENSEDVLGELGFF